MSPDLPYVADPAHRAAMRAAIPAAGSGNPPPSPVSSHPARGYALVSTPRTGLVSPAAPGGAYR